MLNMRGPHGVPVPKLLLAMCLTLLQGVFGQNNVAVGRPTLQNSDWRPDVFLAHEGADGRQGSCTHTFGVYSWHWWRVDLQAARTIKSIRIKNRTDCCDDRLANVLIEVSMSDPSLLSGYPGPTNSPVCLTIQDPVPIPGPVGYTCDDPVTGRYVRIVRTQMSIMPLTLCELEIFETDILTEKPNLALFKPASQRSTWDGHIASYAVDNNENSNLYDGTCTHTDNYDPMMMHWWMVDLQNVYIIESVSITTRDEFQGRLRNFYIEVSIEVPNNLEGFPGRTSTNVCVHVVPQVPYPGSILYPCDQPVVGRYVRVVKPETEIERPLILCDFEVFGELPGPTTAPVSTWMNLDIPYWRFRYVTSHGLMEARSPKSARSQTLNCAIRHLRNQTSGEQSTPLFQVDLLTGSCRSIQTIEEAQTSTSSNWTVYELE